MGNGHDLDFFKSMGVNKEDYEKIELDSNSIGKKNRLLEATDVKYFEYYKNDLVLMPTSEFRKYTQLMEGEYRGPKMNNFVVRRSFRHGEIPIGYLPIEYVIYKLSEMGYMIYHPRWRKYPSNIYTHIIDFVEDLNNFNIHKYVIERIDEIKKEYGRITFGNFNKRIKKKSSEG